MTTGFGSEWQFRADGVVVSDQIRARVDNFARQAVDVHLPVLVGLMAERGMGTGEQAKRASTLVAMLRSATVAPSLNAGGRPVPIQIERNGAQHQLVINGEMLARVDDGALASALAEPVARMLQVSPVSTGLLFQMSDVRQMRGLAGQLGRQTNAELIALTQIEELVRWRLEIFEERLYRLVDGLGGWLEAPVLVRKDFMAHLAQCATRWPEWRRVKDQPYITTWLKEIDLELGRTDWADSTSGLGEMIWESVAISPRSALRQAARNLRNLSTDGDRRELLEVLASVVGGEDEPIPGSLQNWPSYQELLDVWQAMWREEDNTIGARRRAFQIPDISVFETPGESTGFSEPENLPWDQPLLCWTQREQDALGDLLAGMEKSLVRMRSNVRIGRLSTASREQGLPLISAEQGSCWLIQAPSKIPNMPDAFSAAVDRAHTAILASYEVAFSKLDAPMQQRAFKLARGGYSAFLSSTKPIWRRRLSTVRKKPLAEIFPVFVNALAEALEWSVFVDVFEDGITSPSVASMPRFTLPAVWYGDQSFAPVWLPVEALGESLGQTQLRIRNIAVDGDSDQVRWLGDHHIEVPHLDELATDNLLRSIHEGTLMLTIHRQ